MSRGHFRSSHVAGSSIGLALRPEISNTVDRAHYARGRGRSVSGRPEARGRSHPARTYRPIVARTPGRTLDAQPNAKQGRVWQPKSARALELNSLVSPPVESDVLAMALSREDDVERPTLPIHNIHVYDTLGKLGQGQFGIVSQAVRRKASSTTTTVVAIKMLKFDFDREGFPLEALREITLLSSLRHPNIVRMQAVACSPYKAPLGWHLVMDPAGHELTTLVKGARRRPITEAHVKHLMLQLLRAIAALHGVWVMHRDLKTQNVLVDDKGVLRLCDFGLARRVCCGLELDEMSDKSLPSDPHTSSVDIRKRKFLTSEVPTTHYKKSRRGSIKETYHARRLNEPYATHTPNVISGHYRPPEVLLGCRDYGRPIDLWSAGCIFGELLSRQVLFPGKDEPDQLRMIFNLLGEPNEKVWPLYSYVSRVALL